MYKIQIWILIKRYVAEAYCSLNKRIYEYTRDLKRGNLNIILIEDNLETNHNFNFKNSTMLANIYNKKKNNRKLLNITSFPLNSGPSFQFVCIFCQIGTEKF